MTKKYGLEDLAEEYGMPSEEMLAVAAQDSVVPGICTECGEITDVEPDQDEGYCESCEKNTVKSCMVLSGVI